MAEGRLKRWRIDRKIPYRVWIAVGGIAIVTMLLGEAMLRDALVSYEHPLVQYALDHGNIDEVQYRSLPPVQAPSGSAPVEGTFGAWSLGVGLLLATMAAMVRISKVHPRWLFLRSLGALVVAVYSGVTLTNIAPYVFFKFYYVNSTECVEGCYFVPGPIGGWVGTVAIAAIVSGLMCVVFGGVAVVRLLLRISSARPAGG